MSAGDVKYYIGTATVSCVQPCIQVGEQCLLVVARTAMKAIVEKR